MKLRARFTVNGRTLSSEAWTWDAVADGHYTLRFPPQSKDELEGLVEAMGHPAGWIGIEVTLDGLPTVAEISTRLAAVEKRLEVDRWS